jgi:hypothetical protein
MSVNARVVLLVEDDMTLYTMGTYVSTKRQTITSKILTSLSAFGPIFKSFEGPTSVDVIIVLLVG